MIINQSVKQVFTQLTTSLDLLSEEEYVSPSRNLFNATIGQHVRHIIELFTCLENGYDGGIINYERRNRDTRIESDKGFAISLLHDIRSRIERPNRELELVANYDDQSEEEVLVRTNYFREVLYNLEHTIHHMALIRVGIQEVSSQTVPAEFGVAASTIKHQRACAP